MRRSDKYSYSKYKLKLESATMRVGSRINFCHHISLAICIICAIMFCNWSIVITFFVYGVCSDAWKLQQFALLRPLRIVAPFVATIAITSTTPELANAVSGGGKDYGTILLFNIPCFTVIVCH